MRFHLWLLATAGHLAIADQLLGQELKGRGELIWPRETRASTPDGANGWTPKPTEAPFVADGEDALYLARRRDEWLRIKRATTSSTSSNTWLDSRTCGWRTGSDLIPFTCPPSATCATNTDNVVACTSSNGDFPFFTVCLDYNAYQAGACSDIGLKTGCCETSTLGACITYLWAGTSARSMYRCYTSQTIITMLDVPEIAQTTSTPSTSSTTTSSSSTSTTATAPAQTTTSGPGAATSGGSNNTGAIVGGVVGGVAGVALIAGGIAYLIIRNRNKNANAGSGTAYSAVAPGDTSYPGGGPTPSAMSPQMSQAGYFSPGSVGTTLRADTVTPYLAGATPMGPPEAAAAAAAYDPHRSYYDPSKPSEQQPGFTPPPGGYAPYPGHAPAHYPPPQQASELDTTTIPAGHEGNPVEMAATSPTQR